MKTTNDTIPDALRQLLVDAAASIEELSDTGYLIENPAELRPHVALAGRLRDAAAGKPPAVSKVRQNRATRYAAWAAMTKAERIAAGIVTVFTPDRSLVGFAKDYGRPYTGEAGYSRTLRVHWEGGTTTICALKGMVPAHDEPTLPGGFAEWTIR